MNTTNGTRIKFNAPTRTRSGLTYQGVVLVDELHPQKTAVIGIVWKTDQSGGAFSGHLPNSWGWATTASFQADDFDPILASAMKTRAKAAEMVRRSAEMA